MLARDALKSAQGLFTNNRIEATIRGQRVAQPPLPLVDQWLREEDSFLLATEGRRAGE